MAAREHPDVVSAFDVRARYFYVDKKVISLATETLHTAAFVVLCQAT